MATEAAVEAPAAGMVSRRLRERLYMWRRAFQQSWNLFKASRIGVIGLGIMVAFVILALAAPFMGLRDPIRWTAPDDDLIAVESFWTADSSIAGSQFLSAPPVTQPVAFRVLPDTYDPRADRLYVTMENRLYALNTQPDLRGSNAWGVFKYFSVNETDNVPRLISVPPVVMNYGSFTTTPADYEIYLGTSDGKLFIVRDTGNILPVGSANVHNFTLDGPITGLAAYNGDMTAPTKVLGTVNLARFSGGAWGVTPIPQALDDVGEYASLALNAAGMPYVAYYDVTNGQPHVANYSNADWNAVGQIESFSATANVGLYTSLALNGSGGPRVAYYDESAGYLKYAMWNVTAWNVTYVNAAPNAGQYASLALEPGTYNPRIAYYSVSGQRLMYASCDNGCHEIANWTEETVDSGRDVGQYASLALSATGIPHIAYYDATGHSLKHATRPGAVWVNETVDSGGDVGQYASLALDAGGQPGIAYYNGTSHSLKYANWTGAWTNETIDVEPGADVGHYASLAYGPSGPAIAYYNATSSDLKYAAWSSASGWKSESVVVQGHAGLYASLRFSPAGEPVIAYYSFETGRTTNDLVVAGTSTGKLYAIDVGIPGVIARLPREKQVVSWDYRIRWIADFGSEVHLASSPMGKRTNVPLYSPCFDLNGTAVFSGTADGILRANRTSDGSSFWGSAVWIGAPWSSAPVLQMASEGPDSGKEIVYAASNRVTADNPNTTDVDETGGSLLYALYADSGAPLAPWVTESLYPAYGGAVPIGPLIGTPDGGNLTQPAVEGGTIYVGSTSGWLYAVRRDSVGDLAPASPKWKYRDLSLIGLNPKFTSSPVVLNEKGLMLITANHDGGTPSDPADDRGILYSFKLNGVISWKKTFKAPIPGKPASWTAPKSIQQAVWVGYGSSSITGAASLSCTGQFLAPSPPSWVRAYPSGNQYWLGLDSQGRDIFSQVVWGSRIALLVGFMSAIFTVVLGVMVGLIAGYVGGKVESVLMRFTDVILVLPSLPLIITLAAVLGAGIWNIILVISLLGWPGIARIIRAEVLSLKERPFIDSARVTGASTTRIVFRHIAPNVMPLAFLYMTFAVSGAILTEAALSFIGLGDVNTMSWGIMLQLVSQSKALTAWWWLLPPGLAITLISLAFFLVGRAFDEIVNPRLRKR